MKILRIVASMDPAYGGPCQGIRNSVPEHQDKGIHTDVLCVDAPDSDFLKEEKFTVYALGPARSAWGYSATLLPWLLENIRRYDVLIVHGLWQFYSYAAYKAIRILKKEKAISVPSLYVMPHGMLDPYFQKDPSRKIKALRNWCYWNLIENKVVKSASGVLFTCREELNLAKKTFNAYAPKQEINVGYGVPEPPAFSLQMRREFQKKCPELSGPYLLFLSRIHPKKGIDVLIEAYAKWLNLRSSITPSLVVAGPGLDTAFGLRLKQMISANPALEDKIHFTGMLTGMAKWGAFYDCEAFILPSHQENFGIAVVEAMACSKPVLISDKVNIWREIDRERAGLVASDAFSGIFSLLENWEKLKDEQKLEMGKKARMAYKKDFSIANAAHQLLEAVSS
ncbi:glycosyltransferase [Zunongwangia sp. F260]|uniref:Glycosyltransferase n=1 Tax=Autumnicola lenta TaxID=3075593 RepID=A0ABU3CJZ5_9FLAO|nr:glycosyltransferase [Zunongwangia sp. F260]MDT0646270.1 glycosyltransferase [Zunongwangia sp. F260]